MNNNICARINGIIGVRFVFILLCVRGGGGGGGGGGGEGLGYNFCLRREEVVRFDDIVWFAVRQTFSL